MTTGTVSLSAAPKASGSITLTFDNGTQQRIDLVEDQTEYTFTYEHGNVEDPYKDGGPISVKAELEGGGYAKEVTSLVAEASVDDVNQTTTAEIFFDRLEDGSVQVRLELSSPADPSLEDDTVTVTYTVNGDERTATFVDGQTSFVDPEPVSVASDAYGTATKVEVVVSKIEGGNYEDTAGTSASQEFTVGTVTGDDDYFLTGTPVEVTEFTLPAGAVLVAVSDGYPVTLGTGDDAGTYGTLKVEGGKLYFYQSKAYTGAQHGAQGEGEDESATGFTGFVKVLLADGTEAEMQVNVSILDDVPVISGLDNAVVHAGTGTVSDTFSISFGADSEGAKVAFSVGKTDLTLTSEGVWSANLGDGQSITVTRVEGGDYKYSLSYNPATAGAGFEHELTVQVTDGDRDAVSKTVTIEVQNDAPTASSDVLHIGKEAQGGTSTSAGVVINLDKNSDGDSCIVSVLGNKSSSKGFSAQNELPRDFEPSVVYSDSSISANDKVDFRNKFFKDLVDNNVDLENLTSSNLSNIKYVDANSGWANIKIAAQDAASKGMLLYIDGDLTIPKNSNFTFTCSTILNGDLTIASNNGNNYNHLHVSNFLYVIGDVNALGNTRLHVEGGLAVEGNLNIDHTVYVYYSSTDSFSLPKVSINYETEGVELATESREITFAELLENDWDSDAAHHSDLDMDSLAITEFRITDSEGVLHIITVDGVHTKMVDGKAVGVDAADDGTHTIVVRETQKLDADGNPVTDEQGSPVIDRDSVTFDCEGESITMVSGGSNTKNVEFQYQVKDAHGATDLADVSMQVTATSEAGSEGSDIIQGSTTTLVDGAHYNIALSLDRSSSMRDEIETAKDAVQNFIDSLWNEAQAKHSVVTLHFNAFDGDITETFWVNEETTTKKYSISWEITETTTLDEINAMKGYVEEIKCGSGTNYAVAFRDMASWFQEMEVEQADDGVTYTNKVIFITDGEPFTETQNTERDFNLLKQECGDIHTIGINVGNGLSLSKLNPYDTTAKGAELISSADELAAALEAVTTNLPNADATFANKGDDLLFGDQASFSYNGESYSLAGMVKELSGSDSDPTAADIITFAKEHAVELNKYLVDAANDQPDTLIGGDGVDVLYGMGVDDLIIGGGSNTASEGDTRLELADALGISFAEGASSISITSGLTTGVKQAVAEALGAEDSDAAISSFNELIESLESGTDSGDMLFGNSGNDIIFGMEGSDFIDGGTGSDILFGGSGSDIFVYDSNDALIHGGSGIDILLSEDDSLGSLLDTDKVHDIELFVKGDGAESLTSLTALQGVGVNVGNNTVTLSEAWTEQTDGTFINKTANLTIETTLEAEIAGQQTILQNQ